MDRVFAGGKKGWGKRQKKCAGRLKKTVWSIYQFVVTEVGESSSVKHYGMVAETIMAGTGLGVSTSFPGYV